MYSIAEKDTTVTLRGIDRNLLIQWSYDDDGFREVLRVYVKTKNGIVESQLAKKRVELDLPFNLEEWTIEDRNYREEMYRDEALENMRGEHELPKTLFY